MMRGTALVASNKGGFTEYVQHEQTGLLVAPDDHAALGSMLLKVIGDREYAESLGQAARRFALTAFDQGQFLDRFIAIYEGLTKARSASA
jgi:starch synthase